jgi:hypothetical protein
MGVDHTETHSTSLSAFLLYFTRQCYLLVGCVESCMVEAVSRMSFRRAFRQPPRLEEKYKIQSD